jgi:hypothetical protein
MGSLYLHVGSLGTLYSVSVYVHLRRVILCVVLSSNVHAKNWPRAARARGGHHLVSRLLVEARVTMLLADIMKSGTSLLEAAITVKPAAC